MQNIPNFEKSITNYDLLYNIFIVEYELVNPETIKHEAFGASNKTFQVIPQVGNMK